MKLATAWGSKQFENALAEIAAVLLAKVKNEKADAAERLAPPDLVAEKAGDAKVAKAIIEQINPAPVPSWLRACSRRCSPATLPKSDRSSSLSCRR